jgi:hypothetical protein
LAFLCCGVALLVALMIRKWPEVVGTVVALLSGIAIVALAREPADDLAGSLRGLSPWLLGVTLLGTAAGFAARLAGPAPTARGLRSAAREILRVAAAVSLGAIVAAALPLLVLAVSSPPPQQRDTAAVILALLVGVALGGWIAGRATPRYPVAAGIIATLLASVPLFVVITRDQWDFSVDGIVLSAVFLSIVGAMTARIASSRRPEVRDQRERDGDGYAADLWRLGALGLVAALLLEGVVKISREACELQRLHFDNRVARATNFRAPVKAIRWLEHNGLEVRLLSGDVGNYEIEVDEPQNVCNMFSRKTLVARHPPR